jgi:8-oxo-dGTP pyrophosphatase MutT (NUDIX family)
MNGDAILPAIRARLDAALAAPHPRYRPWRVDGATLGFLDDARALRLARFADVFAVTADAVAFLPAVSTVAARSEAMAAIARTLRAEGELPAWRDELYAVAPAFDAPMAFALERGAARWFGVHSYAAHVNGYVAGDDVPRLWLARRSATKAIDPGMLDNLVGGGIAAGATVLDTVVREAWEEAGIAPEVARTAQAHGAVRIRRALPDGLQDETVFIHDLALAADFVPANQDGESVGHRLVDLDTAARLIAATDGDDVVTVDASLVTLDFLLRHGAFRP